MLITNIRIDGSSVSRQYFKISKYLTLTLDGIILCMAKYLAMVLLW